MDEKISKSVEDYLEAILMVEERFHVIHSSEVAKLLNVSRPAVAKAMHELTAKNYINMVRYGEITLTENGRQIANSVYDRHKTIKLFLLKLGISEQNAERDCCLIEHVLSDETYQIIKSIVLKERSENNEQ